MQQDGSAPSILGHTHQAAVNAIMAGTFMGYEEISPTRTTQRSLLSPVSFTPLSPEKYASLNDSILAFEQLAAANLPGSDRQSALDLDLYEESSISESRFSRMPA